MKDQNRKTIIIKRYQNRKLYDTQNSTYVTLDDIAKMVRNGEDVRIIDNRTNEDLSSVTLTQILFEEEKRNHSVLPLNILKRIIQDGGEAIRDIVNRTTGSVQHTIQTAKEGAETIYDKLKEELSPTEDNLIKEVFQKTKDISSNLECKLSDSEINPMLNYLKRKFPDVPAYQVSLYGKKNYISGEGVHVCPAAELLKTLI